MNYLAHMYLSGDDEQCMIGNFIADAVKGKRIERYSAGIQRGIRLHRAIDTFTDTHPIVVEVRKRLHPLFHKYSGVVVDMYFDHFLARSWEALSNEVLHQFTRRNYQVLVRHFLVMPARMRRLLPFMIRQDWLSSYAYLDRLDQAFKGLSRRTAFVSGMEEAVPVLTRDYEVYRQAFDAFFPQLVAYTRVWDEGQGIKAAR